MSGPSDAPASPARLALAPAAAIGAAGALLFLALVAPALEAQGAHGDELHQAPAAFWHLGQPCTLGCAAEIGGVPVLSVSYSGAVRGHLYGLVLRARGAFDLGDWRWTGLVPAALAVALLPVVFRRWLGALPAVLAVALLATDVGVGVLSRFDFGPVTVALLLRVLFAAGTAVVLIRGAGAGDRVALGLGAVAGFALYEKLSNVALLPAFALAWWELRAWRARVLALAGLAAGALPLVAANLASWFQRGELVSLAGLADPYPMPRTGPLALLLESLGFGHGTGPADYVFGLPPSPAGLAVETVATALLLAGALAAPRLFGNDVPAPLAARRFAATALSTLAVLAVLPRTTYAWHWILAVPFGYLAAAFLLEAAIAARPPRRAAIALTLAIAALGLASRAPRLIEVRAAMVSGRARPHWSPELVRFARWAAEERGRAIFVVTDWGLAPQLYCWSNGARRFLWDALWDPRPPSWATVLADRWGLRRLYLARPSEIGPARPERVRELESAIAGDPRWREVPVPATAAGFEGVSLRAFDRVD